MLVSGASPVRPRLALPNMGLKLAGRGQLGRGLFACVCSCWPAA